MTTKGGLRRRGNRARVLRARASLAVRLRRCPEGREYAGAAKRHRDAWHGPGLSHGGGALLSLASLLVEPLTPELVPKAPQKREMDLTSTQLACEDESSKPSVRRGGTGAHTPGQGWCGRFLFVPNVGPPSTKMTMRAVACGGFLLRSNDALRHSASKTNSP